MVIVGCGRQLLEIEGMTCGEVDVVLDEYGGGLDDGMLEGNGGVWEQD